MLNIHASLVALDNKGILLLGKSGCGKSDLALRLIMEKGAKLVADDRVDLFVSDEKLFGATPQNIAGKLEIRGVGIGLFPVQEQIEITLCVELCPEKEKIERLPNNETAEFLGVSVTKLKLYPFECSTLCKIIAKISGIICSEC